MTVHATRLRDLQRALGAGVDDIAHMVTDRVPDEVIQQMIQADVSWVPTFEAMDGQGMDNLRRFVAEGGSIYASDWAYDVVEVAFPSFIDFFGDDARRNVARVGDSQEIRGSIADTSLAAVLGGTSVELNFDLDIWAAMETTEPAVDVYVRGTVSYTVYNFLTGEALEQGKDHRCRTP